MSRQAPLCPVRILPSKGNAEVVSFLENLWTRDEAVFLLYLLH